MDKDLDHQIYNELVHSLPYRGNFLCQRKTLHTRILKLSVAEGKYSSIGIGKISLESGQFQKSLIQLKKALIINPDYSFAQVSLAEVCFKLEKENEAFSILNEVLLHDPGYTMAHQIIIGKLKEQDRFGDLDSFYQEIINRFSDDAKSVACLYCGSAQALTGLNERSKALKMYKKAREVDPNSGDTYQYAYVLYQEGEFEESRVQFEKLWQWNPTSGVFASNVAFMTYCMGRLQQAFEEFEELIANGLVSPGTYSNFILTLKGGKFFFN